MCGGLIFMMFGSNHTRVTFPGIIMVTKIAKSIPEIDQVSFGWLFEYISFESEF